VQVTERDEALSLTELVSSRASGSDLAAQPYRFTSAERLIADFPIARPVDGGGDEADLCRSTFVNASLA
jgi:hypothetical protein